MNKLIKRLCAIAGAAAVVLNSAVIPTVSADPSIVTISTPDELIEFLKGCTSDEYSRGRTFVMYNDIDMRGQRFSGGGIFCGTFMGNGHQIKNISMDFREANGGLFSNIGEDGQVRDLNLSGDFYQFTNSSDGISADNIVGDIVKNAGISGISPTTSTGMTGAIAAVNSGLIVNCSFEGKVSGQKTTGGIVGQNKDTGTIDTCANAGTVSGYEYTGGIAGENAGVIKNSRNTGEVNPEAEETAKDTGGIAGYSSGVIEYSTNEGEVGCEGYGTNAGGIAGKQNGALMECVNTGFVGAKKNAGGIVGIFVPFTDAQILTDDIRDEWNKQRDDLKEEADKLRDKLKDTVDDLTDSFDKFNLGLPLLGSSDNADKLVDSLSTYIDKAADRRQKSSDALTDGLDALSDLTGALQEAVNDREERKQLQRQLTSSLQEMSESVTQVSDSMSTALDRTEAMADSVTRLADNMTVLTDDTSALLGTLSDSASTLSSNSTRNSKSFEQVSDSMSDALDRIDLDTDALDDTAKALLNLSRTLDDVVDDLSDFNDEAASTVLAPFKTLQKEITDITNRINEHKDNADKVKSLLDGLMKKLYDQYGEQIRDMIPTLPPTLPTIAPRTTGKAILNSLFVTARAANDDDDSRLLSLDDIIDTERIKEEMKKVISVDVELDRHVAGEYTDTALVKYCVNQGEVRSTENAGGIAGNMGVETLRKRGETYQLPDGKTIVSDLAVKATVHSCINEGEIYAKERFAGGIVGASNVGIIKSCLGAGDICAENSGYAGGIGGDVNASIIYSVCAARLNGKNDLGGIAGSGNVIRECYSLASFDGDAERIGMIAGSADGDVKNNCFIFEEVGGIGGASYETNAQNIPFEQMKCTDKLPESMTMFFNDDWTSEPDCFPQIKSLAENEAEVIGLKLKALSAKYAETSFTVNFIIDGETVKTLKKEYNEKLSDDEIPTLTGSDGRYPHWNRDTSEPIRRHTDFKAEYNDATMTIASEEEPPILLVEGNFSDKTTVTVTQSEVTASFPGYVKGNAYSFKIEPKKDAEAGFRMHVLSRDKKTCAIGIVNNGEPEVIECDRDGSYLVCHMDKPQSFVILSRTGHTLPIVIFIAAAAIAAGLMGIFGVKGGKRIAANRIRKKEEKEPGSEENLEYVDAEPVEEETVIE